VESKFSVGLLVGLCMGIGSGIYLGQQLELRTFGQKIVEQRDFGVICGDATRLWSSGNLALSCWRQDKFTLVPLPGNTDWKQTGPNSWERAN
jgi:hypothetical protein